MQELQDIVEQIDMAATFAKIGGFGRLIALVTPSRRLEKVRECTAASLAPTYFDVHSCVNFGRTRILNSVSTHRTPLQM